MQALYQVQMFFMENVIIWRIICCVLLFFAASICNNVVQGTLRKAFDKKAASSAHPKKIQTLSSFTFSVVKYVMAIVFFYIFCSILSLPVDSIFIALAGAVSVAFGFGAQTLFKNIINGFFILAEDEFSVGDVISVGGFTGTVEEIGIRTTKIRSVDGNLNLIPNGEIEKLTNMTKKVATAIVEVSLPYDTDRNKVIEVLKDEMLNNTKDIDGVMDMPTVLGISAMAEYTYAIKITAQCEAPLMFGAERELRLRVLNRLDKEGIKLPTYKVISK